MHEYRWNVTRAILTGAVLLLSTTAARGGDDRDAQLRAALQHFGFTGAIESTLVPRLGRPLNPQLANLGRFLFFDTSGGLVPPSLQTGS